MTLSEFKAWFEGYTDGMDEKAPSAKQWAKIKEKVAAIDGAPTLQTIWLDHYRRYYPSYAPYWANPSPQWGSGGTFMGGIYTAAGGVSGGNAVSLALSNFDNSAAPGGGETDSFDPHSAMYALGKAEAASQAA